MRSFLKTFPLFLLLQHLLALQHWLIDMSLAWVRHLSLVTCSFMATAEPRLSRSWISKTETSFVPVDSHQSAVADTSMVSIRALVPAQTHWVHHPTLQLHWHWILKTAQKLIDPTFSGTSFSLDSFKETINVPARVKIGESQCLTRTLSKGRISLLSADGGVGSRFRARTIVSRVCNGS